MENEAVRRSILDEGIRLDGRKTTEIRPIWIETDYIPGPHGSAVFTRGETQALATVTLGTKLDEKILDDVLNQGRERFLLHYNFPPFSTGEAKPQRGVGRREVGHGNLAHRALKRMFPADFPYVCRIVSDILGDEDHLGDMDFKVTGTADGITATQMDIKCDGLSYEILEKALLQARDGRLHILNLINNAIPEPRQDYKAHVPRIVTMLIPKELIGAVIGPGGKIIQGIQEESGATVSIDEIEEGGHIEVAAPNRDAIDKALAMINAIVELPEEGKVYDGTVRSIMDFGAFVEFMPHRDGLLHISEIAWERLDDMEASGLKEGDKVQVKLIEIDKKTGKYRLSMRALLPKPEGYVEPQRAPRGERGPRREGAAPRGDRGPRREGGRGPRQPKKD